MGGRQEAAAGGGEAAEVDGIVVAGVVLRIAGGAGQQPQEPFCRERRGLSARGRRPRCHGARPWQEHRSLSHPLPRPSPPC